MISPRVGLQRHGVGLLQHQWRAVEELEDALGAGTGELRDRQHAREHPDGRDEREHVARERQEHAEADLALEGQPAAEREDRDHAERRDRLQQGLEAGGDPYEPQPGPEEPVGAVTVSWSSWRCSCPKPLTIRTPVTDSSTTVATSPASCCASQLAGNTAVRSRSAVHSSAGVTSSITSVSGGERYSMIASEIRNIRRLPITIGRNCSRPWISMMSEPARLTSWPVCISS